MYRAFRKSLSSPPHPREKGEVVGTPHTPPRGWPCRVPRTLCPLEPCFVRLAAPGSATTCRLSLEPCSVRPAKKPALVAGFATRRWYAIVQRGYVEYAVDWHPGVRVQVRGQVALG